MIWNGNRAVLGPLEFLAYNGELVIAFRGTQFYVAGACYDPHAQAERIVEEIVAACHAHQHESTGADA